MKTNQQKENEELINYKDCNIGDVFTFLNRKLPYLIVEKTQEGITVVSNRQRFIFNVPEKLVYRVYENSTGIFPEFYEKPEYQLLLDEGRKLLEGKISRTMNITFKRSS